MSAHWLLLAAACAAAAPRPSRAQYLLQEVPEYELSGSLLLSYGGSWQRPGSTVVQSHLLSEGLSLGLSGWIGDSRYVRFRSRLLLMRLDALGGTRSGAWSLGYGGTLLLFSRSIVPVSLGLAKGLYLPGSTAQGSAVGDTTTYSGTAQLVSPLLPKVDLRAQRMVSQETDPRATGGTRTSTNDALSAGLYGGSALQRYAGVFNWDASRTGSQPRTSRTMASLSDDIYFGGDTRGHLQATITQGTGFGGAQEAGFTGYQLDGSFLTRIASRALLRGGYAYAQTGAADREETTSLATAGSTIDLRPLPVFLGEGLSAGWTRWLAPGLDRTLQTVSAAQGVAVSGRRGPVAGSVGVTGQAGYTSVSDGRDGRLLGYGLNGALRADLPGAPLRVAAQYDARSDRSSASLGSRSLSSSVSATVTRLWPWTLLPLVNYVRVERSDPSTGGAFTASNGLGASLSGTGPLGRTRASFSAGYTDAWSDAAGSRSTLLFLHLGDSFRVGPGTFGNLAADVSHPLGGATTTAVLASLLWSFRESTLSASYSYSRAWPSSGSGQHVVALLFSRGFQATFLPESR